MKGKLHVFCWQRSHQSLTTTCPSGSSAACPFPIGLAVPQSSHVLVAEPGAAHNEGRAMLLGDSDGFLAALMCELGR
jgi:hypothetical protein